MARVSSDPAGFLPPRSAPSDSDDQRLPLVVDMDGFLIEADISADTHIAELETKVVRMRRAILGRIEGDAVTPLAIAEYARKGIDVTRLQLKHDVVAYLTACVELGREVHLITSASQEIADAIAARIGGFASATGAAHGRAMLAADKLSTAKARCAQGFVYAGREPALIGAAVAIVAPARDRATLGTAARSDVAVEAVIPQPVAHAGVWLRLASAGHLSRLTAIFLPVMTAPSLLGSRTLAMCAAGFGLACLAASSIAITAALVRLYDDRCDVVRGQRPYALGQIEPGLAAAVAVLLGAGSLAAALSVAVPFFLCLLGFIATRLGFVWWQRGREADRAEPLLLIAWPLAMGAVLAGTTPLQTVPAVLAVIAIAGARRWVVESMVRAIHGGPTAFPTRMKPPSG